MLITVVLFVGLSPIPGLPIAYSQEVARESFQVLKVSASDQRAVVKLPDGTLRIIKMGDSVGGKGKVTDITHGRVVIEDMTEGGIETIIIRLQDGKQNIERIRRTMEKQPGMYAPK